MNARGEALLVIDMLEDFCAEGAPLFVPSTREVIPAIARELSEARAGGAPVVYVCDAHAPDDPEFAHWPPHAVRGTDGARVVAGLSPRPGDEIVHKTTLFGFYETRLDEALARAGAKTLTITGCVTSICVMYTAAEAAVRGYRIRIPRECVAGLDPAMDGFAFRQMEEVLGAELVRR